jgi:hypothetical protein
LALISLAQDALGAGDGQMGDLVAQGFLGTLRGGTGFGSAASRAAADDAAGFGAGLVDQLARLLFGAAARTRRRIRGPCAVPRRPSSRRVPGRISPCPRPQSPSAILLARSSSAFMMGGHTNFIVNHARMRNTTSWANSVAFRFTVIAP